MKWYSFQDARLEGGYENVPTRDIHMNQVGYEKEWLHFLDMYVRPLQEAAYTGYYQKVNEIIEISYYVAFNLSWITSRNYW